nr:MAG TPA: hypothetical protein [Caudoviricetes sp.]
MFIIFLIIVNAILLIIEEIRYNNLQRIHQQAIEDAIKEINKLRNYRKED